MVQAADSPNTERVSFSSTASAQRVEGRVNSLGKDPEVPPFHVLIDLESLTHFGTPRIVSLVRSAGPPLSLSETQTRTYWWCSPPKIGGERTRPVRHTSRRTGASFCRALLPSPSDC
jgi:hypothetical protein